MGIVSANFSASNRIGSYQLLGVSSVLYYKCTVQVHQNGYKTSFGFDKQIMPFSFRDIFVTWSKSSAKCRMLGWYNKCHNLTFDLSLELCQPSMLLLWLLKVTATNCLGLCRRLHLALKDIIHSCACWLVWK